MTNRQVSSRLNLFFCLHSVVFLYLLEIIDFSVQTSNAVAYFENVDNSDDIVLKVDIGNSNTITFIPGNFTFDWKVSFNGSEYKDMPDQPFHPRFMNWNEGIYLQVFWWDKTRKVINIMNIKSIEYTHTGKRWIFTGTLQERYNTMSEIDSYQESLFTSK